MTPRTPEGRFKSATTVSGPSPDVEALCIREMRLRLGWSLDQLARRSRLASRDQVYRAERGVRIDRLAMHAILSTLISAEPPETA